MERKRQQEIEGLRDIYGYHERYELVLAAAFEPDIDKGCEKRFDFYDSLGEAASRLGKRMFLPHRHIDLEWPPEKILGIMAIVIPSADLVVSYLGINSTTVGIMNGEANHSGIPISYIYEKEEDLGNLEVTMAGMDTGGRMKTKIINPGFRGEVFDLIEFGDDDREGIRKLEHSLRRFYQEFPATR